MKNEKVAVQFLLDKKASSTAADRYCIDDAFTTLTSATMFRNKNYIKFLVGMLDFERWVPDYAEASEQKYPAIGHLYSLSGGGKNIAPYLIKAIKESDSEVLRTNAAETLIYPSACKALRLLKREAEKEDLPSDQRMRLEDAAKYIDDRFSLSPPCEANPPY